MNYRDREGCVDDLYRNMNEANNLIKQADSEMTLQRENIIPVLKMINIVA